MAGNWDIRRIYLYLVSFATLMMMIFGTVTVLQRGVNLVMPNPDVYYTPVKIAPPEGEKVIQSEEEIKKQNEQEKERQRLYAIRDMINSLILVGVALPVYLYHWRKIQRAEA